MSDAAAAAATVTTLPYAVCVLNVHGSLNVGSIMRSAHLCGCRRFIVFGRRKYDKRSAVGVQHYIDVERVAGLREPDAAEGEAQAGDDEEEEKEVLEAADYRIDAERFHRCMTEGGLYPVFVEQCAWSERCTEGNLVRILRDEGTPATGGGAGEGAREADAMPCFVFGNEQHGVPPDVLALRPRFRRCHAVELRQLGSVESFNVASCAAIVLYKTLEAFLTFLPEPSRPPARDPAARAAAAVAEGAAAKPPPSPRSSAPRKPADAFGLYCERHRGEAEAEAEASGSVSAAGFLSDGWRRLSREEREVYAGEGRTLAARYAEDLRAYRAQTRTPRV